MTSFMSEGVTKSSPNTLGGKFAENRGRRSAGEESLEWERSPFEDGRLYNWNNRSGWDDILDRRSKVDNRKHGGSIIENRGHRGKGPRGYKRSDAMIYEDVCQRLLRSSRVDARHIEVSVREGIVTLEGIVVDRATKKNAEYISESVSGVRDVQNRLYLQESLFH